VNIFPLSIQTLVDKFWSPLLFWLGRPTTSDHKLIFHGLSQKYFCDYFSMIYQRTFLQCSRMFRFSGASITFASDVI